MVLQVIIISIILGVTACTNKGAEPVQPVSIIVKTPNLAMVSLEDESIEQAYDFLTLAAQMFAETEAGKNVEIVVDIFNYIDEDIAIPKAYGTPNAADVLYEGYFNMGSYISEGHVVPLDDIISDGIRADFPESSWKQSMVRGKTYMMPFLSMQNVIAFNKRLFRECGLDKYIPETDAIQNWSLAEWEEILDTLAATLPERSYPMFMYAANNQGDTHIMSLIRSHGSTIFDQDGNFDFESDEAVAALEWIQNGVARGWYPPHAENLEPVDNDPLFRKGQLALHFVNNTTLPTFTDMREDMGLVNFPNSVATSFITGFEVFDNGDPAKLEAGKQFVKFIYETPELMALSAGSIPESRTVAAKYADRIPLLAEFSANAENVVDFINGSPNWQGNPTSVRSVFYPHIHDLLKGKTAPRECAAALDRDCNAAIHVPVTYHE